MGDLYGDLPELYLDAKARIAELEDENARLKSRGIEDMHHRIAELEALLQRWLISPIVSDLLIGDTFAALSPKSP